MSFDPVTNPVDFVIMAGRRSPGIAEVQGFSSPRQWDERRGFAMSGSRALYKGNLLSHGKLLLRLYSAQDWADWHEWREIVQDTPAFERARAIVISHPILADLGINAVVVEDVKQPVQTGDGEWTIEILLMEWRRPERAIAQPDGSDDRPPEPADPAERTMQALAGLTERVSGGGDVSFSDVTDALAGL